MTWFKSVVVTVASSCLGLIDELKILVLDMISNLTGPNDPVGPLIRALIRGVQPTMAGGPLSPCAIKRGGAGSSNHEVDLSRAPHRYLNPNPIREGRSQ